VKKNHQLVHLEEELAVAGEGIAEVRADRRVIGDYQPMRLHDSECRASGLVEDARFLLEGEEEVGPDSAHTSA